jgi:hypothetical protein
LPFQSTPPPLLDRLSLLPNELLHGIFESAYSDDSPEAPLSKHLYPFFEEHFYRRVHLSSPRQVDLFLETISNQAGRGRLVKSLEFDRQRERAIESLDILETLFPLLPNLLHLELRAEMIGVGTRSKKLFGSLSKVQAVSIRPRFKYLGWHRCTVLDSLAFLTALPSLTRLTVLDWPVGTIVHYEEEEAFTFSHVRTLSIEGRGADEETIENLVNLCPALLSIELRTTFDDEFISYEPALEKLPATLQSLKLTSDYVLIEPEDLCLRRFTLLQNLDLDKSCYSSMIHSTLADLPLLVNIRLGPSTIDPVGFLSLVSGPTRLVNLRRITLDFDVGVRGNRIKYEAPSPWGDWIPSQDLVKGEEEDESYVSRLGEVLAVAEETGIEIEGTVYEALANFEDYWIEENNRVVVNFYSFGGIRERGDLETIRGRLTGMGVPVPAINVYSLDLNRLEVVQMDLPEHDWYLYSLRNEAGASVEEEGSGEGSS